MPRKVSRKSRITSICPRCRFETTPKNVPVPVNVRNYLAQLHVSQSAFAAPTESGQVSGHHVGKADSWSVQPIRVEGGYCGLALRCRSRQVVTNCSIINSPKIQSNGSSSKTAGWCCSVVPLHDITCSSRPDASSS